VAAVKTSKRTVRRQPKPAALPRALDDGRESLDLYLDEISRIPLLTVDEEKALARKAFRGEIAAQERLARHNVRFVVSVAKQYQNRGVPLMDLIGEGNVGLMTAARKFDPDRGVKFISYAVWWIRQAILAALARQGRTVRVPLNRTADLSRIVRTAEYLRQTLRREPTPEEIADATKLSLEVVQSLAALNTGDVRLVAPLDPDGDRPSSSASSPRTCPTRKTRPWTASCRTRSRRRWAPCSGVTPRCCGCTSAWMAAASTRSRRSAACSASRASEYDSCAIGR